MIPNLSADELLFQRGDYLKSDQREWLAAFILLWEYCEANGLNPDPLCDYYEQWIEVETRKGKREDEDFLEQLS
jgi:hypothetical protein